MSPMAAQMTQDEACSYAMAAMASGSVPFMVLRAIVELDVFEIIKRAGPGAHLSPYEIAARLPTKNPDAASMLDRMLQVLASYSVFSCEIKTQLDGRVDRVYGLAPVCKYFTKNEDGVSFSALALMHQDRVFMESWYYLKDAVLDGGIAFNKAHGKAVFEYIGTDPRFNKVFNNAMSNHSTIIMKRILETYNGFEGLSTLVDVGGGTGAILNMIISKYPTIKGINFDLPHVIADAPEYDGVEHVGGDMFVSVPKGDAIFMKWICHSWTDEYCLKFLKTCHAALPDHGKVIVCEFILPVAPENTHSARTQFILDAIMLAHCAGGKERTQPEYERLAKEAGFKGFRIACSAYDIKIIEFLKMNEVSSVTTQLPEDELCSYAMTIAAGSIPPMVLRAVVELDVLEIIKKAGVGAYLSPEEIAAQLPTKNPEAASMLDRMLRLLASYYVLSYSLQTLPDGRDQRLYGLAPVCKFLTKNDDGVSLGALSLTIQDKILMESWYYLKDAVLDGGIPFNKAYGKAVFEYIGTDPRFNNIFNNGMSNHSTIIMKRMLKTYKGLEGVSTLVDVGGGTGATLNMIISKKPIIKGINFDLPHVTDVAPTYTGVEHIGGDMFVSVPKGDAMFMKWICHSWTDEQCLKFLKNCYASLPEDGKVIVCEYVLPTAPETSYGARTMFQCDALMLAHNTGGKERTKREYEDLAKKAGFKGFTIACSAYDTKIMEFLKIEC